PPRRHPCLSGLPPVLANQTTAFSPTNASLHFELLRRQGVLLSLADRRPGRRTVLSMPLLLPPQKKSSPPSDSSPDTRTPGGISSVSRTSPVRGSTRRRSATSSSHVPCHSSPSTPVT